VTRSELSGYRLDFLDYLLDIRGYSELTVKSYDEALQEGLPHAELYEEGTGWIVDLMPFRLLIATQRPRTIARKLSAWRSFTAFIRLQGRSVRLRSDESVKVPKSLPKPISHEHIMQAAAAADVRERMVLYCLYGLGLRISELHSLRLEAITTEWVRVVGKGDKMRDIPLPKATYEAVSAYRRHCAPKHFLCECDGKRLSENSLRYLIQRAFARVGIAATPHQLRHAYATELLAHQARIADVSELLGHASMATTQIYTKLGSALKMDNYKAAHPLCKEKDETR